MSTPRTLFTIGADLLALDQLIDELGGDVSDPRVEAAVTAWFAELSADEARKLDGWVGYVRQLEMESAAAKAEAEQYQQKARTRDNRVAWLKATLKAHLAATGRTKVETATKRTIAIQKNGGKPPVVIDQVDPAEVPDHLCQVRRTIDPEKVRLALELGEALPFARLGDAGTHLRVR